MPRRPRYWNEYPKSFYEALEHFNNNQTDYLIEMPRKDALMMRTQFYRFFESIRAAFDAASIEEKEHTGLNYAYFWSNQLIPSTVKILDKEYFRLRIPYYADSFYNPPPEVKARIKELAKQVQLKQEAKKDDFSFLGTEPVIPTTTLEEIKLEKTNSSLICPNTERPCRKHPPCSGICIQTGEQLKTQELPK